MPAFPSWAFTRCHHHSNCGSRFSSCSLLLIYRPRKDERLSWPRDEKQETVGGSGINWAICSPASRPRQTPAPAPHHYRLDALPAMQPTALKHWRKVELHVTIKQLMQLNASVFYEEFLVCFIVSLLVDILRAKWYWRHDVCRPRQAFIRQLYPHHQSRTFLARSATVYCFDSITTGVGCMYVFMCVCMYVCMSVCILWARVQTTLDPYAEAFL